MYIIGVDIGTTGTKATLMNHNGKIINSAYMGCSLMKSENGYVEQYAEDWWNTFVHTVKECASILDDPNEIKAISLSTQGGSLVCVDKNGTPLSHAMVWMDMRAKKQHESLIALKGEDFYYQITGWKLSVGLNLCKIKWLKEKQPELFNQTYKFLSTIDFVNFKLTGEYAIDPSNSAMTQLYDIRSGAWSSELLELIDMSEERLPEIRKSASIIGSLTTKAATVLGLPQGIQIVSGGHDQYCAATGSGATYKGQLVLSTGTAFAMLGINDHLNSNTETYISPGPHIVDGLFGEMATVPTAGVCMERFKHVFCTEELCVIDEYAQVANSDALYFYPYFSGSAFPHYQNDAKASILGLSLEHTKYDIAKAVMEGIAFQVKYALERFDKPAKIKIIGGACKSSVWLDIITNILDAEVYKVAQSNVAPIGAAMIAGVGCGLFQSFDSAYQLISEKDSLVLKNYASVLKYKEKYRKYKEGMNSIFTFYGV